MSRLEEKVYTYFGTVRGMCRKCREVGPAKVYFRDGKVWQESLCPKCVNEPALIAGDMKWYLDSVLKAMPDNAPLTAAKPQKHGCPHDCGPCTWHASNCQLPVISITNACNLRCPICFTYNRSDKTYYMPVEEMTRTVDWIIESSKQVDLINITGGEPSLHPQILEILRACQRPEIGRVTMNSNGIVLAENYELCQHLAELGIYVILSFNTFDPEISIRLHGRDLVSIKSKAVENLTRAGVKMTLLNVLARGVNESSINGLFKMLQDNDNVLSLTVQTMTYTGQGGGKFNKSEHIPVDDAARIISAQSGGQIRFEDFCTRPSSHPLCYMVAYMLKNGRELIPFARFSSVERLQQLIANSYLIRPCEAEDFFKDCVNELYASDKAQYVQVMRGLIERRYPMGRQISDFERQKIAESAVKTIYIHAHMDEDTFDCSRAMQCPDLVPSEPGKLVPACTYNLFYRMKDERFYE